MYHTQSKRTPHTLKVTLARTTPVALIVRDAQFHPPTANPLPVVPQSFTRASNLAESHFPRKKKQSGNVWQSNDGPRRAASLTAYSHGRSPTTTAALTTSRPVSFGEHSISHPDFQPQPAR